MPHVNDLWLFVVCHVLSVACCLSSFFTWWKVSVTRCLEGVVHLHGAKHASPCRPCLHGGKWFLHVKPMGRHPGVVWVYVRIHTPGPHPDQLSGQASVFAFPRTQVRIPHVPAGVVCLFVPFLHGGMSRLLAVLRV